MRNARQKSVNERGAVVLLEAGGKADRPALRKSSKTEAKSLERHFSHRLAIPALCVLLTLATTIVYGSLIRHEFIDYDDDLYVTQNAHVNTGLTWTNVRWALTTDAVSNWHPLTWVSHMLDCELFGLDKPGAHHAISLLLHVLNVLLLFLLLNRGTGAIGRSFVVAALFALHPFNVESVAWLSERKNLLCTLFFLLAIGAYGWYARKPALGRYLCVAALFALGLASKPMVITLPFALLLLDFWPLGRVEKWSSPSPVFPVAQASFRDLVLEKLPLMAMSAASGIITFLAQRTGSTVVAFSDSPFSWRVENALWAYATYLWKTLFPVALAPFYPTMWIPGWKAWLSAGFVFAVSWLVWKFRDGRPYLTVGYLWFLGTLVPVIGIVQVGGQSMADRYSYIPLIGIFTALVWSVYAMAKHLRIRQESLAAAAGVILLAFAIVTWRQVSYWKNSVTLWEHALDVTADNYVAEESLAVGLATQGRDDEAYPHFLRAREINPQRTLSSFNLARSLELHGRHQAAIQLFEFVIHNNPDEERLFESHRQVALIYGEVGNYAKARAHLIQAISLRPGDTTALADLSALESELAAGKLASEVTAHPTAQGYYQLGQLLEGGRKPDEARTAYDEALKLDPNLADAQKALDALATTGR